MSGIIGTMTVNMYRVHESEEREACHAAYVADTDFPALESRARARGFRHATLSEINASADAKGVSSIDLHCWAGGLWVKFDGDVM